MPIEKGTETSLFPFFLLYLTKHPNGDVKLSNGKESQSL